MTREAALLWSQLNVLTKQRYDALVAKFGGLDEAVAHVTPELLKQLGCREDTVMSSMLRLGDFDLDAYDKEVRERGLRLLTIEDDAYPRMLREIGDPPVFLYAKGDLAILDQPCVALVGTREMSPYGKRVAEAFVGPMVAAGLTTVSGLAEGIDSEVAKETLAAAGKTVACLGHGFGMIFPASNKRLAEQIVDGGGLLLSEFPIDAATGKHTFPARNRVIAGLSLGTVVLEAPAQSGAIITAELALEYGRDVFAVPGAIFDPNYEGCHRLIARGQAKLVAAPDDELAEIGIVASGAPRASSFQPSTPEEAAVLALLTPMPQTVDDLAQRSPMDAPSLNAALTMLELAGAAKNVGGGQWVRN